jgi:hypothetical protein
MGLSVTIPQLKEEIPHGVHECIIDNVYALKDANGDLITYLASPCVVFSFDCNGKIFEKVFRIGDQFEYKTFKKLLAILGVLKNDVAFNRNDVIGKKVCIFIQKVINRETGEHTMKIVNYKPAGKNYTYITSEIYV